MIINFDLLGIPCSEYCEHDGVKGVFIPEVPNFKYTPGTGTRKNAFPPKAVVNLALFKSRNQNRKYDYAVRQLIPQEHLETYLANPV